MNQIVINSIIIDYTIQVCIKNNNKIVFVKSKIILLSNKTIVQLNNKNKKT